MNLYHLLSLSVLGLMSPACREVVIPPAIEPEKEIVTPPEKKYNEPDYDLHEDGAPYDTYRGLVMAGYQGWFGAPGDGCKHNDSENTAWYHYRESEVFKPGVLQNSIDYWPDMSEYTKRYTPGVDGPPSRSAKFILPSGEAAQVYSAYDESSVLLHFKWMSDYGIDGVFMQRFVGEVIKNPAGKDHFDTVLKHAMKGSNQYGRAICVMYDLGGFMEGGRDEASVVADAQSIMDSYHLLDRTRQKYYLYENGKPLIALWGIGFDEKPFNVDTAASLVKALQEKGWSVMLGVNDDWRTHNSSKWPRTKYQALVKSVDIIFPWFVGRYGTIEEYNQNRRSIVESDIKWCKTNNVIYAPHCFPGSSDRNMHPNNGSGDRLGGKFLWEQIYQGMRMGAEAFYIAMFDEIDEGTAIYKCLNKKDVPSNVPDRDYYVWYNSDTSNYGHGYSKPSASALGSAGWCKLASELDVQFQGIEDNLPTDHYLWLTGQARKMLRGEIPFENNWPTR